MTNTRQTRSLIRQIEKTKARIAAERDRLRDLISDLEAVADASDRAVSALEEAADSLSEML